MEGIGMALALWCKEILDELPDDEDELNDLLTMVGKVVPEDVFVWSGRESTEASPEKEKPSRKKISIVLNVVTGIFVIALIAGAVFISSGDKKTVLGYSIMNVITWSMEPEIPQGSLVIVKKVDANTIKIGDDITYMKDPETSITHRVTGITENYEDAGARGFETQGIDNDAPDFEIVRAVNVVGVVRFSAPRVGNWLEKLGENPWYMAFPVAGWVAISLFVNAMRKTPTPADKQKTKKRRKKSINPAAA